MASVVVRSGIPLREEVSATTTSGVSCWASGDGGGRELVEEAMLMGRRESGVLVKEFGAESSARDKFARRELRKAG